MRSITRLALVGLPLMLGAVALLLTGPSDPARAGAALLWLGAAIVGLAFWSAVILLVRLPRRGALCGWAFSGHSL